jgi:ACS family glucarate transporter-like MFS transporter
VTAFSAARTPIRRSRVRWQILGFLFAFSIVAYVQRTALSVAGERMMPDLGLTQTQLGWLLTVFLVGYTGAQFPGGVVARRLGGRLTLTVCGIVSVAATLFIPAAPLLLGGNALLMGMLAAQAILGVAQGPVFGVTSGSIERWFPQRQWALAQGLVTAGINIGAAITPPLISTLMVWRGWAFALAAASVPPLLLVAWWWLRFQDDPACHPGVSQAEIEEIGFNSSESDTPLFSLPRIWALLADRNLLLLSLSYGLMNFVFYLISFWSFLYLVQVRGFSALQSGWLVALPFLTASIGSTLGGLVTDRLVSAKGTRPGLRLVPLLALPAAGLMLPVAVNAADSLLALAAIAACFFLVELTEASFWAGSMAIGQEDAAIAGGLLNTGGNLGGIVATPFVAALTAAGAWHAAFLAGTACSFASTLLWFVIDTGRPAKTRKNVLFSRKEDSS